MKGRYWLILVAAFMVACSQGKEKEAKKDNTPPLLKDEALRQVLIGEWESLSVRIEMPTWDGGDSTAYVMAEAHNWPEVMQMQPIRTYYLPDGTYYAEYRNLAGQITNQPSGTWEVKGDTLIYHERYPENAVFKQEVARVNETDFRFSFYSDFDLDGEKDDFATGISRKVR